MHTKDDKAYATLTDVKNKTGDVFALADQFGEVTITSYNKSKYAIRRLVVAKIAAEAEPKAPSELEAEAAADLPATDIVDTVVPVTPTETITPITEIPTTLPVTPEVTAPAVEPITEVIVAEVAEVIPEVVVEVTPIPTPIVEIPAEPTPVPQPVVAEVQPITPSVQPIPSILPQARAQAPIVEPPAPPVIEIIGTSGQIEKSVQTNKDIVGIFAGIGFDSLWDRSRRSEQEWVKNTHNLL